MPWGYRLAVESRVAAVVVLRVQGCKGVSVRGNDRVWGVRV